MTQPRLSHLESWPRLTPGSTAHLMTAVAAALLLALAPGCSRGGSSGGAPTTHASPTIASFQADKAVITKGDSATLAFSFAGGTATLDPNLGTVTSGGTVTVTPDQDTDYTLTVRGAGNAVLHRVVTVKVVPVPLAPDIQGPDRVAPSQAGLVAMVPFEATYSYNWSITNGTITSGETTNSITFDAGPAGEVALTCIVSNAAGKVARASSFKVTVGGSEISSFRAVPGRITAGKATSLLATFSGGTGMIEPGGLAIASGTALTVTPLADTLYTLTVYRGTTPVAMSQAQVDVLPALVATPITLQGPVEAGAAGHLAWVDPQPGCRYQWQIGNGTITAGDGTERITFTAGAAGPMTLDCTITNQAGDSIATPQLAATVLAAPAPSQLAVTLVRPVFAAYRSSLRAEVNPVAGATYAWELSDGTIDHGGDSNAIVFTAGGPAPATLRCVMTLAGGVRQEGWVTFTPTYPVIGQFDSSQGVVTAGRTTTLNFVFSGGTGVVNPGGIAVTSPGSLNVAAGAYTLTVTDDAGNRDEAHRTITSVPMPVITGFTTSHAILGPGQEADLTAAFDAGPGGTAEVETLGGVTTGMPLSTGPLNKGRTFTLRVTNAGGDSVTRPVTVRVATLQLVAGRPYGPGNGDGHADFARFKDPFGLARDAGGNLYIADTGNHTIRKLAPDGKVTTLAGRPAIRGNADGNGTAAQFYNPVGLALDADGNLYVADMGNSTIRKVTPDGTVSTLAGEPGRPGSDDGTTGSPVLFDEPFGIAVSPDGTRVFVSDRANNTIRAFHPGAVGLVTTLIAGQTGVSNFMDGPGATAAFRDPTGLALGGDGSLYVSDFGAGVIRKLTPGAGGAYSVASIAGRDMAGDALGVTDGDGLTVATFFEPFCITVDSLNNLYVTDNAFRCIRKLTATAGVYDVSTLAGDALVPGNQDGDPLHVAQFNKPQALAVDPSGTVFVADGSYLTFNSSTIRAIPVAGDTQTLAGALSWTGSDDGIGRNATFNLPKGLVVGGDGVTYVCDANNHMIRRIAPDGTVTTFAGSGLPVHRDGDGIAAAFSSPSGIAMDSAGNLFVADTGNQAIRRIAPNGTVTTVAGGLLAGYADGPGATALFNEPAGIAVDAAGNLYVADFDNHAIRKIDPAGMVSTLAGDPARDETLDGPPSVGALSQPFGIALDGAGSLIVSDTSHHTLRKVNLLDGSLSTLAGDAGTPMDRTPPEYLDAVGSAARFNEPSHVAVDANHVAYVADFANGALRMIAPDGTVSTVLGFSGKPHRKGAAPGPLPTAFAEPLGVSVEAATGNILVTTRDAIMKVAFK